MRGSCYRCGKTYVLHLVSGNAADGPRSLSLTAHLKARTPFASSSPPPRAILGNMQPSRPTPETVQGSFAGFHPVTAEWFRAVFDAPTEPQRMGWPAIARGESALILAPTGTGKTLAAFLWCLDRLMLEDRDQGTGIRDQKDRAQETRGPREQEAGSEKRQGCRIVYVSPLKALAVDVERNLRSPLAGMAKIGRAS